MWASSLEDLEEKPMSKREYYKRTIIFLLASLVIIAQALVFAYLWYNYYRELIYKPFWRRGKLGISGNVRTD